jgi:hypothetical protein
VGNKDILKMCSLYLLKHSFFFPFYLFIYFQAQGGLELLILLPPQWWDYNHGSQGHYSAHGSRELSMTESVPWQAIFKALQFSDFRIFLLHFVTVIISIQHVHYYLLKTHSCFTWYFKENLISLL